VVCSGDQPFRRFAASARRGEADARAYLDQLAVECERLLDSLLNPDEDGFDVLEVGELLAQNEELVSSESGGGIGRADRALDSTCRLDEDLVADRVTELVVYPFEPIQIQEEDSQ
jgi:hypothetical protein